MGEKFVMVFTKNSLLQVLIERETLTSSEVFSKDCDVTTVFTCLICMYYFHVNSCTSWCAYFLSYFIIKKNVIHVQQNFRKNKNN